MLIIIFCCILIGFLFFQNTKFFKSNEIIEPDIEELESAYQWAFENKITSQSTIENANLNWYITRAQLAKMMSSFSSNVLGNYPNTWENCEFNDVEDLDANLQLGILQVCQFWIMWKNVKNFRPSDRVTLWEFSVVLTRALWWDEFQWWEPYYKKSLKVLNKLWIVDDISWPLVDQKRWWVMLMLKRSSDVIKKSKKEIDDLIYREYFVPGFNLWDWNMIPTLWFWTWWLDDQQAETLVYEALKIGYRHIDTARYYANEKWVWHGIQRAINEWIITREEVFVTTKVIPSNYSDPNKEVDIALENLWLEYIDLMLVHQPWANDNGLYHAFEKAVEEWKVHSIWISNYYTPDEFDRMYAMAKIKPVVVQNENHIFYQNTELKKHIKKYWTVLESWYPLGWSWHINEVLSNGTIKRLAEKYDKTPAQIVLRWQLQDWNVAIPWSSDIEHLKENYNIFDFELTNQEMKLIHVINKNKRYENF